LLKLMVTLAPAGTVIVLRLKDRFCAFKFNTTEVGVPVELLADVVLLLVVVAVRVVALVVLLTEVGGLVVVVVVVAILVVVFVSVAEEVGKDVEVEADVVVAGV
jgi:hypothetical protein